MAAEEHGGIEVGANAFGRLVRAYRKQRGMTQQDVAGHWGVTREYISAIERGERKLYRDEQVLRLAEILGIPLARLEAIGKQVLRAPTAAHDLREADDVLLQALLEPARATVKLSWLVWYGNVDGTVVERLQRLTTRLEDAVSDRRGRLRTPAVQLLAHAHEMLGKVAFDKLDYATANGHFVEMQQLGEELGDPDILTLSAVHQGDLMRRRGRYELAVQRLEAAEVFGQEARVSTEGLRWQTLARAHAEFGDEPAFLRAIDLAQAKVTQLQPATEDSSNDFTLVNLLRERAHGYTLLWQPTKALDLYEESKRHLQFQPLRDLGNFTILQAQAHAYAGNVEEGVRLGIEGLGLARRYESKRHISRVQRMYDRLSVTPMGISPALRNLAEALQTP